MNSRITLSILIPTLCSLWVSASYGQTFIVGDSVVPVTNPAGFTDGDSILFQGNIQVAGAGETAVTIDPVPSGVTLTFAAGSVTASTGAAAGDADGVGIRAAFDGTFNNLGTISSLFDDGVDLEGLFSGTFTNSGTITAGDTGVNFNRIMSGVFVNTGTITGGDEGVDFDRNMTGTFTNSGTIVGENRGVEFDRNMKGLFTNSGTIISNTDSGVYIDSNMSGTFNNSGSITGSGEDGVEIGNNLNGTFINSGSITGVDENGVYIENNLSGTLINTGTIRGLGTDGISLLNLQPGGMILNSGTISGAFDGIYIDSNTRSGSTISNSGNIIGASHGIHVFDDHRGMITNTGTVIGADIGILIEDVIAGDIFNSGVIEGTSDIGIWASRTSGTIRNHGGRIQGGTRALRLGGRDATVVLSGPSNMVGLMDGGGGTGDVLRFENMRGISDAKKAELAALAAADSTALTTITLFGEQMSWRRFEDIQADLASLQSYQSLITGPGLANYAAALDNVQGLNDSFRDFLRELNDVDASLLNDIARNTSGQSLINGMNDFARDQDQRLFSLFSNHFSSLRGGVSGRNDGIVRSGLFTREVQAGVSIDVPDDEVTTFVTGYFGNSTQRATAGRSQSSADNTSIIFGQGKNISNEVYLGFFGGYTNNENDFDRFGSLLQNETGYVGIDAQYESGNWFANLVAAYGYHDQKSIRRDFLGNRMEGNTEGNQGLLYSQLGHDFFLGEEKQARITPYLGFSLSSLSMRSFAETGPAATSLRFADQTISSVQSVVGVNVAGYKEVSCGWLKPTFDAAWWHAYDGAQGATVSLAAPGLLNGFGIISPGENEDRGVFQIGIEAGFDGLENWTFQANYFGTTGSDGYSSHGGSLSAKVEF